MASRSLSDLHPALRPLAARFLARCAERGLDVLVTCTYRSDAEQDALYAQGRTAPGPIVTRARAGQSAHNATEGGKPAARAFDVVPMLHGKPIFEDPRDADSDWTNDWGWRIVGEVAAEVGLDWYGRPGASFREAPHLQLRS
jgi:peptidoglycan L-alanyl-D-glutamate endopeptidase CwlK